LSCFGWCFTSRLALDHDVKVNKLVSERAHVIFEAEGVFANGIGGEDIVPLSLALSVEEHLVIGVLYFIVDVEGTTALNSKTGERLGCLDIMTLTMEGHQTHANFFSSFINVSVET
jgi:hypothetical protein